MSNKETLEEAAEKYAESKSSNFINTHIRDFKEGAKWQSERMYSEEIEILWLKYRAYTNNEDAWSFKEWLIEQFKKQHNEQ